ncbi:unnamed protein product [Camellia sinensis]
MEIMINYKLNVPGDDCIMDIVVFICVDTKGHIASGASSGGIALKDNWTCGISSNVWLQLLGILKRSIWAPFIVGCCVSVAGLGSACMIVLRFVMQDSSQHGTDKSAGALVVKAQAPITIAAAYTSLSFGIGYFGSSMEQPKSSQFLRLQNSKIGPASINLPHELILVKIRNNDNDNGEFWWGDLEFCSEEEEEEEEEKTIET